MTAAQARARFSEVVSSAAFGHDRVVLTRRGKAIAAVVSIEDLALLQELEERKDVEDFRRALRLAHRRPTVRWQDLKSELGL